MHEESLPPMLDPDLFEIAESMGTGGITLKEAIACLEKQKTQDLIRNIERGKVNEGMLIYEIDAIKRKCIYLLESLRDN